ncbi:hypothetical protein RSAG8_05645, partial [Rhizoctonia solani AG-8 WAC10335]
MSLLDIEYAGVAIHCPQDVTPAPIDPNAQRLDNASAEVMSATPYYDRFSRYGTVGLRECQL